MGSRRDWLAACWLGWLVIGWLVACGGASALGMSCLRAGLAWRARLGGVHRLSRGSCLDPPAPLRLPYNPQY